jgi:RNA polymerase sigma-70 factor (ECF subfamily)
MLESSEEAVKSALKRARATLDERRPEAVRRGPPEPDSPLERELVRRFADAFESGDVDGVVALLTEDALISMPPATLEYQGPGAIGDFLREVVAWRAGRRTRLVATRANTQPAFGSYRSDPHAPIAHANGLVVLTLAGERIAAVTQFLDTSLLARFGLPRTLGE